MSFKFTFREITPEDTEILRILKLRNAKPEEHICCEILRGDGITMKTWYSKADVALWGEDYIKANSKMKYIDGDWTVSLDVEPWKRTHGVSSKKVTSPSSPRYPTWLTGHVKEWAEKRLPNPAAQRGAGHPHGELCLGRTLNERRCAPGGRTAACGSNQADYRSKLDRPASLCCRPASGLWGWTPYKIGHFKNRGGEVCRIQQIYGYRDDPTVDTADLPYGWHKGDTCVMITNKAKKSTSEYIVESYDGVYFGVRSHTGLYHRVSPWRIFRTKEEAIEILAEQKYGGISL